MTRHLLTLTPRTALLAALGLLTAGAAAAFLVIDRDRRPDAVEAPGAAGAASAGAATGDRQSASAGAPTLTLTPDLAARAGIRTAAVTAWDEPAELKAPGVVEANAYQRVVVTPLVAGRVTDVLAELGESVTRGRAIARVHSPELAEALAKYRSIHAMLGAHDRELARTERLAAIGAASRQELERLHAEHTSILADLDSARATLALFGVTGPSLDRPEGTPAPSAVIDVPAPLDGVVLERSVNAGANVDPDTPLFTVANLSTVWIIAELYERDFARVPVGTRARVRSSAYPDLVAEGRVSYIDPQVSPDTRTAKVRIEIPNPGLRLRLGMFADVMFDAGNAGPGTAAGPSLAVPRAAVQTVGDQSYVYVESRTDSLSFEERTVRIGRTSGASIEVLSGLGAADRVVVEGTFAIRAEIDRQGLRRPALAPSPPSTTMARPPQQFTIRVTKAGFEPSAVTLAAGVPARLTFLRTTDETCAKEVVFSTLGIRRTLPLDKPVDIEIPPQAGTVSFVCGMDMLRGTLVVR